MARRALRRDPRPCRSADPFRHPRSTRGTRASSRHCLARVSENVAPWSEISIPRERRVEGPFQRPLPQVLIDVDLARLRDGQLAPARQRAQRPRPKTPRLEVLRSRRNGPKRLIPGPADGCLRNRVPNRLHRNAFVLLRQRRTCPSLSTSVSTRSSSSVPRGILGGPLSPNQRLHLETRQLGGSSAVVREPRPSRSSSARKAGPAPSARYGRHTMQSST